MERESLWFEPEKAYGLGQGKVIVWDRETLWKLVAWGRGSVWFGEVEGCGLGKGKAYGLGQCRVMVCVRESIWFGAVEGYGLGQGKRMVWGS